MELLLVDAELAEAQGLLLGVGHGRSTGRRVAGVREVAVKEFASVVDSSKVEPLHRLESAKRLTDGESA